MAKKDIIAHKEIIDRLSRNFNRILEKFGVSDTPSLKGFSTRDLGLGNIYTEVVRCAFEYRLSRDPPDMSNRELNFLVKFFVPRDKDRPGFLYAGRESPLTMENYQLQFLKGLDYFLQPISLKRMDGLRIFDYAGEETAEKKLEGKSQEEKKDIVLGLIQEIRKFHSLANDRLKKYVSKYGKIPSYLRHGQDIGTEKALDNLRAIFGKDKIEELPAEIIEAWPKAYSPIDDCFEDELEMAHGDIQLANILYHNRESSDDSEAEGREKIIFFSPKLTLIDQWFDIDSLFASHGLDFSPRDREVILEQILSEEAERSYSPRGLSGFLRRKLKLTEGARQELYSISHRRVVDRALRKLGKNADVSRLYPETWESWRRNRPSSFLSCNNDCRKTINTTLREIIRDPSNYKLSPSETDRLSDLLGILDKYAVLVPREDKMPYANPKGI